MSLEPQTNAKVRLSTTKGPIDIELWAKEAPINSRKFLENVLNGKFHGLTFDRIISDFIIQLNGDVLNEQIPDEYHSRLKFNKRGLIGCVNSMKQNTNDGRFFITLRETPELNGKNTIIGKVVDDTIFNVLKIAEGKLSEDGETPLFPVKVIGSQVLIPWFNDLKREQDFSVEDQQKSSKRQKKKKKGKVKLSLGDNNEDDGGDNGDGIVVKMKSAHDVLGDKKLSKKSVDIEKTEETLKVGKQAVEKTNKQNEDSKEDPLISIKGKINGLKAELNTEPSASISTTIIKNKQSKQEREQETLELLKSFTSNLSNAKPSDDRDDGKSQAKDLDFDNLSESDSDVDIYSHRLKFEDNNGANKLANEQLLLIDTKDQHVDNSKRLNQFYAKEPIKRTKK